MPARTSVLMQGTDTMRRSPGLVERILRFADNVVAGAKTLLPKKLEGLSMRLPCDPGASYDLAAVGECVH